MTRLKKTTLAVVILLIIVIGGGYLSARAAQKRIEQQLREYVLEHKISGFDLRGPVPPSRIEVYSEVRFPFVVVGSYAVPRDMHASYYRTTYLALPWGTYLLSKDEIHLV